MDQSNNKALEVDDKFVEHAPDAYPGLSPEDAEFMRGYEGNTGKKVVKKVCQTCSKVASTDARRLTFDSSPLWPFCIYLRISTEEILETRKSRGWTRILALLETSTTSPALSFSCPTSFSVSSHKKTWGHMLINYRGTFQYCLEEG